MQCEACEPREFANPEQAAGTWFEVTEDAAWVVYDDVIWRLAADGQPLSFVRVEQVVAAAPSTDGIYVAVSDGAELSLQFVPDYLFDPSSPVVGEPITIFIGQPLGEVALKAAGGRLIAAFERVVLEGNSFDVPHVLAFDNDGPTVLAEVPEASGAPLLVKRGEDVGWLVGSELNFESGDQQTFSGVADAQFAAVDGAVAAIADDKGVHVFALDQCGEGDCSGVMVAASQVSAVAVAGSLVAFATPTGVTAFDASCPEQTAVWSGAPTGVSARTNGVYWLEGDAVYAVER